MTTIITPEYLASSGSEHGEQTAFFCWLSMAMRGGFILANDPRSYEPEKQKALRDMMKGELMLPKLRWMHAIPNGGARGMKEGAKMKAEGVKGGVADTFLPVQRMDGSEIQFTGLYIELKRADGVPSNFSQDQLDFGAAVTLEGYAWFPAFGWRQAADLVHWYMSEVTPANVVPHLLERQEVVFQRMMVIANEQ